MNADANPPSSHEVLLSQAETMIWALLDDQLDEADITRLEQLLTTNEAVRHRYVECVQLHADLTEHFSPPEKTVIKGDILQQLMTENLPSPDSAHTPLGD